MGSPPLAQLRALEGDVVLKLTTRGRYGVAAMAELAARQEEAVPIRLRDIASSQSLSESYLEQLLLVLRRAGLVRSARGAQGGYSLAKDADQITVGDILRVLEGPIAPVACLSDNGLSAQACSRDHYERCGTRAVWARLARCMGRVLDSVTLSDLVDNHGKPVPEPCADCDLH